MRVDPNAKLFPKCLCASNSSKLSTSIYAYIGIGIDHNAKLFLSAFDMRLDAEISFTLKRRVTYHGELLRCQYLYFCTRYREFVIYHGKLRRCQYLYFCTCMSSKAGKLLSCTSPMFTPKVPLGAYADVF